MICFADDLHFDRGTGTIYTLGVLGVPELIWSRQDHRNSDIRTMTCQSDRLIIQVLDADSWAPCLESDDTGLVPLAC